MLATEQKDFPEEFKFSGSWRSYQRRVLNDIEKLLGDDCLNIVAAPGAGKTTLGIEVVRMLGKPALIVSPTITIKQQWKERLTTAFLPECDQCDWVSDDIKDLKLVTTTTYQALHSVFSGKEKTDFLKQLRTLEIGTLVLDEAHHLRTEWWKTLTLLVTELRRNNKNLQIVSLTATPPYDVSPQEWANYSILCGEIDAEISVPELIKSGDLCPHQDLIYFSSLNDEEEKIVFDFNKNRALFFENLKTNAEFSHCIKTSPWSCDLDTKADIIFEDAEFTCAVASYLLWLDPLDSIARTLAEFIEIEITQLPQFDYKTAQIFLNGVLGKYKEYFKNTSLLKHVLRELNLTDTTTSVSLTGSKNIKSLMAKSINKLNSIKDIVKLEYEILNDNLRLVVLLDFIGRDLKEFGLNILSVFKILNNENIDGLKIGILTGSSVVIPKVAKDALYRVCEIRNIDKSKVLTADYDENHLRVEFYGSDNHNIVSVITELFSHGEINVLIGTQALLGEGWDSPTVNSLILASTVGSFMLSNQMRGRAIRISPFDKNKTANIWHLCSLEKSSESDWLNNDYDIIQRRFSTFEGLVRGANKIESGIERLGYAWEELKTLSISKLNAETIKQAKSRITLKEHWRTALSSGAFAHAKPQRMYEVTKIKDLKLPIEFLGNKIAACKKELAAYKEELSKQFLVFVLKGGATLTVIGLSIYYFINLGNPLFLIALFCLPAIIPRFAAITPLQSKISNLTAQIEKLEKQFKIQQSTELNMSYIGESILQTLCEHEKIKTPYLQIRLVIQQDESGVVSLTIDNCKDYERALFSKCVREYLSPIDNPRYILKRQDEGLRTYYFAVPEILSGKKEFVENLAFKLEGAYGWLDVIYTRTPLGRRELLKARCNPISQYAAGVQKNKLWM